MNANRSSFNS